MNWPEVIFYSVGLIVGACCLEYVFDLVVPARLERFKLEQYKDGIRDGRSFKFDDKDAR